MTGSAPNPKLQARIETVIRALAPVLDLVVAAGDRTSRLLDRGQRNVASPPVSPDRRLAPSGLDQIRPEALGHRPQARGPEPARH